jgi:hypothetical protein
VTHSTATAIVGALRTALDRYRDYHVAERNGSDIFHPEIPQSIYHFTNYWEGVHGRFFPQLFGWMVHVYPFGNDSREDLGGPVNPPGFGIWTLGVGIFCCAILHRLFRIKLVYSVG